MITFKQFLSETELKSAADLIQMQCKPFLDAINGNGFLYRGIKGLDKVESHTALDSDGNEMEYAVKTVRQDRTPLDLDPSTHNIVGSFLKDRFGWNPRTEGVFAFGEDVSMSDLKAYGEPCVIFPIGEIKYVWSRHVEDLYSDMKSSLEDGREETVRRWLSDHEYQDKNLDIAVMRSDEVMIKCDKYLAFPIQYKNDLKKVLK
jgi:hypothetical protein